MKSHDFYDRQGVLAWVTTPEHGQSYYGVSDAAFSKCQVTFFPLRDGTVAVGVDAEGRDCPTGTLIAMNPEPDPPLAVCGSEDTMQISDSGLLTVLARPPQLSEAGINYRQGFTLQFPTTYIHPLRLVIDAARASAARKLDEPRRDYQAYDDHVEFLEVIAAIQHAPAE